MKNDGCLQLVSGENLCVTALREMSLNLKNASNWPHREQSDDLDKRASRAMRLMQNGELSPHNQSR